MQALAATMYVVWALKIVLFEFRREITTLTFSITENKLQIEDAIGRKSYDFRFGHKSQETQLLTNHGVIGSAERVN